jgi:peptidoglycan hydrolase-like protein with peptidoglycan-binding domain
MFQKNSLLDKLRELEKPIFEALSPEEKKELDTLAAELDQFIGSDPNPELESLLLAYQKISQSPAVTNPGVDPKVQSVQKQLMGLGIDIGKTGADGKMGPATIGGIKAFEKMAGMPESGKITPDLETKLANGATIKSQNNLVASITALEKLLTKYKLENVEADDIDVMTEEELLSFVMKHMSSLSESEKMEAMKLIVSEAGPRTAAQQASMSVAAGNQLPTQAQAAASRFPASPAAPATPAPAGAPSRLAAFGKSLASRVTGAGGGAKGAAKAGAKLGARLLPGVGWGLLAWDVIGAAMDALKDPSVQLDPADKAELDKHGAVLKSYLDDPAAASGLPKDLQQRLSNVSTRMQKMASGAAPQSGQAVAAQPNADQMGNTVAA